MKVKLISITAPVDLEGVVAPDELIAFVARVSNPQNQSNTLTAPKLVKYLAQHKHWSPFEMVDMTLEIETTRAIAHQIIRHRSFSFQEFSQRYANVADLGSSFTKSEARLQDTKNRQNSIELTPEQEKLQKEWNDLQQAIINITSEAYKWAIDKGIAKEVARNVLPEGLTNSRIYMKGSVRSWIHYIQVRADPSTQKEHREVALAVREHLLERFPSLKDIL